MWVCAQCWVVVLCCYLFDVVCRGVVVVHGVHGRDQHGQQVAARAARHVRRHQRAQHAQHRLQSTA